MQGYDKELRKINKPLPAFLNTWKAMIAPVIFLVFALFNWYSPVVSPVKYITVFFHELSHGVAAIATGGSIEKITLSYRFGGVCYTRGGNRFIILNAGYVGSLLWGALILISACKLQFKRELTVALGFLLFFVAAIWIRNMEGLVISIFTGAALIGIAKYGSEILCDQILRSIGLISCFYAIFDIKSDAIDRTIESSDAYKIGQMFSVPDWFVGIIWIIISAFITWRVLKYCFK